MNANETTILITGSSGFIGTNLVDELLNLGYKVIGVSLNTSSRKRTKKQLENRNYFSFERDITDIDNLASIFNKFNPNIVIHLAAQAIVSEALTSPIQTYKTNIKGTWNVLEIARQTKSVKKVIIASSDKAYGEHNKLPYDESFHLNAIHPYDISKKITEELAYSFYKTYDLPIVITRC